MAAKIVFVFCVSALFVQVISGQCSGSWRSESWSAPTIRAAAPAINVAAPAIRAAAPGPVQIAAPCSSANTGAWPASTSGGAFPTSSASFNTPSGLSVQSELLIEGPITVWGEMPFVSAVALEGILPTSGLAIADYSCGDGKIGITSESAALAYDDYSYAAPGYAVEYAAPAYAASAYAAPARAAPALAPAVGVISAPIASGFARSPCGCDGRRY